MGSVSKRWPCPGASGSPSPTPTGPGSPLSHNPDPVMAAHQAAGLLAAAQVTSVVVDCESGTIRLGLAAGLARALDGTLLRLDELAAGPLADSVRELSGLPRPAHANPAHADPGHADPAHSNPAQTNPAGPNPGLPTSGPRNVALLNGEVA